ncbi:MAG: hypothetical protein QM831_26305 [Kofleriaceae bacterium]
MRIFKNLVAVPTKIIGGARDRAKEFVHRVLDRIEDVVGGPDRHLATSPASPTPAKRIAKLKGHKKPRAERRKARRAALR